MVKYKLVRFFNDSEIPPRITEFDSKEEFVNSATLRFSARYLTETDLGLRIIEEFRTILRENEITYLTNDDMLDLHKTFKKKLKKFPANHPAPDQFSPE